MPDSTTLCLSPPPQLRPWVTQMWVSRSGTVAGPAREHVLPTGQMHLVFRIHGPALTVLDDAAPGGAPATTFAGPVVGGPRATYYAKRRDAGVRSVGAVLRPGAARVLFGASAEELAGRHTALADLWGADAHTAHAQIASADGDARRQLDLLCRWLTTRSADAPREPPDMVSQAMAELARPARVDAVVQASRYSHRGFIARFRQTTGLAPKRYARLMRFARLLAQLRAPGAGDLAHIALDCGFSDQPHMSREFLQFAGLTPHQYRLLAPAEAHHVVPGVAPR